MDCDSQDALRAHFQTRLELFSRTRDWNLAPGLTLAAVLVGLIPRTDGIQVVLTRRTEHLHHHPGQISFPGGHGEDSDGSPVITALREAQEEVGVEPACVELLGTLPNFATPSGFRITPVVGLLPADVAFRADPFEVAEIFEVPLKYLADPTHYQRHRVGWVGAERHVYIVPYAGRFIWGATAGILHLLAGFIQEAG